MNRALNNSQKQAQLLLSTFSISDPNQIASLQKIIAIAEYHNVHVIPSKLKNCLARISIIDNKKAIIRYNMDIQNEHLVKFSIAHELGHFLLHNKKLKVFTDIEEVLVKSYKNKGVEKEADDFASELLMPTEMFIRFIQKSQFKYPDFNLIIYLSEIFNTSITATTIKLVTCGQFCIALIASEDNKIKWYHRDPDFPFKIKNIGTTLDTNTCASDCFKYNKQILQAEELYAKAWVIKASDEEFIKEHTFYSEQYNFALSIIWKEGDTI